MSLKVNGAKPNRTERRNKLTIITRDFNTPLLVINKRRRQEISQDRDELNNTISQLDLNDIYRTLYTKTAQYTFFSSVPGKFTKIEHIKP